MAEKQLLFPFPQIEHMDAENYVPLPSNNIALGAVYNLLSSDQLGLVLYGESGVGKTHLAHIFSHLAGVPVLNAEHLGKVQSYESIYIVDNLEKANAETQEQLFHIFNHVKSVGGKLLFTSSVAVAHMENMLPDLKSRLLTLLQLQVEAPSDAHLEVLLVKFASDNQLQIEPAVVQYIVKRCSRNIKELQHIMNVLNEFCMVKGRKLTIPLVKEALE